MTWDINRARRAFTQRLLGHTRTQEEIMNDPYDDDDEIPCKHVEDLRAYLKKSRLEVWGYSLSGEVDVQCHVCDILHESAMLWREDELWEAEP